MRLGSDELDLSTPQVMAIVNLTPDSFFEGSRFERSADVERRIEQVVAEGASILDVGGYSSRPDAEDVPLEEEWQRVSRGVKAARMVAPAMAISVDTFRSEVVRRTVEEYGAVIVNDISAGEADEAMADVVARYNLPYVAMHMRGTPQTMQQMVAYPRGVVVEVSDYFEQRVQWLKSQGVEQIILDPGFGFAKSVEQNYELLAGLHSLVELDCPLLVGVSRKSMIYKVLEVSPSQALNGTTALHWEALRQGATILRAHDVREAVEVVRLYQAYEKRLSV